MSSLICTILEWKVGSFVLRFRISFIQSCDGMHPIFNGLVDGIRDSLLGLISLKRYIFYISKTKKDLPNNSSLAETCILKRVVHCCILNGLVFWLSISLFNYKILPLLRYLLNSLITDSHLNKKLCLISIVIINYIFGALWVMPLFILSRLVNCLWFQDIADEAYKRSFGKPKAYSSIGKMVADTLFSLLQQAIFLLQCLVVSFIKIPFLSTLIQLIHFSLLYSLYSFEYKWFNFGFEINRRLKYVEKNWPYFIGFGMPLALLTYLPNSYIISGIVFSLTFPIFILSANEAKPITHSYSSFPLKFFGISIFLSNIVIRVFLKATSHGCKKISARSYWLSSSTNTNTLPDPKNAKDKT